MEQVGDHHPYLVDQSEVVVESRHRSARAPLCLRAEIGELLNECVYPVGAGLAGAFATDRPGPSGGGPMADPIHEAISGHPEPGGR